MIKSRTFMARDSLKLSLKERSNNNINIADSFCVFDLTEKIGVELKFVDIPSLEGMYVAKPKKTVLISSHRPAGRQRFTCAHELGHHFYNHGKHIDEFLDNKNQHNKDKKEILADLFASFLLMPASTVNNGFIRRGWKIETATPIQVYTIACWLGVGYTTLINHMQHSLMKLNYNHAGELLKQTPKILKRDLLGSYCKENVIPVDIAWSGRPVDIYIGDLILLKEKVEVEGSNIEKINRINGKNIYRAVEPGIGNAFCKKSNWATFIRVSKSNYNGRSKFRHFEDD